MVFTTPNYSISPHPRGRLVQFSLLEFNIGRNKLSIKSGTARNKTRFTYLLASLKHHPKAISGPFEHGKEWGISYILY